MVREVAFLTIHGMQFPEISERVLRDDTLRWGLIYAIQDLLTPSR